MENFIQCHSKLKQEHRFIEQHSEWLQMLRFMICQFSVLSIISVIIGIISIIVLSIINVIY